MGLVAALSIGAAGLQAYGQYSAGMAKGSAEDMNAATDRQAAQLALEKGAFDAEQTRKAGLKLTSSQEAHYAANGVALSGSPLLVMEESAANNETDALLQKYNAKMDAKRSLSDAQYRTQLAYNYRMDGAISAGTTLLTSAASAAMKYGTGPSDSRLASNTASFGGGVKPYSAPSQYQINNATF